MALLMPCCGLYSQSTVNTVSNSQIGASLGTSQAADTQNIDNKTSLKRVIEIDNAWLDKIDVFFIKGNEIVRREVILNTSSGAGTTQECQP